MTGKTHATVGVLSTAALIILHPKGFEVGNIQILPIISLATAALGSYLPDIDIHQSALGRKYRIISKMLKHRGFTHTLVMPLCFLLLMYVVAHYMFPFSMLVIGINSLLFGLMFGWILHIFADMFNKKGVPLLFPITNSRIYVATVKTRHRSEYVWLALYIVCISILVVWLRFL